MQKDFIVSFIVALLAASAILFFAIPKYQAPVTAPFLQTQVGEAVSPVAPSSALQNTLVRVDVTVTNVTDLTGAQLDVQYDASVLTLVSVQEGNFLSQGVSGSTVGPAQVPPILSSGYIKDLVVFRIVQPLGVSGSGTLFTLYFNATGSGAAAITIPVMLLSDSNARLITNQPVTASTIYVSSPDTQAPSVSILAPSASATVGGTVLLTASATDNVGVNGVTFSVDGKAVGTVSAPTETRYSLSWDSTRVANGGHTVTAAAVDAAGNAGSKSVAVSTSNNPGAYLVAPTNLQVTGVSTNSVSLGWQAASDSLYGISKYNVYRANTIIASPTGLSFTDSGLLSATTYSYAVSAVNGAGVESAKTALVSATTDPNPQPAQDPTPPTAPTGLAPSKLTSSSVKLNWNVAVDPESGVEYYVIYRDGARIATSSTVSYTDIGLSATTTYQYTVSAVNTVGLEGARSGALSVTTRAASKGRQSK